MSLKTFLFLLCLWWIASAAFAQRKTIDSLKTLLKQQPQADTLRVKRLAAIGFLERNSDIHYAQRCGEEALALADSLNYELGMAESYGLLGLLYYRQGLHELAISHHLNSLSLYEKLGVKKFIAYRYNDLANAYVEQEFYDKSLEFYSKSLAIKQEINDIDGVGTTLKNIANLYIKRKQYDSALHYATQAVPLADSAKNGKTKADLLNFIGEIYLAQNKAALALSFFEKSLDARQAINDKFSIPRLLNNMGAVYAKRKDYAKALDYLQQAIKAAQLIKGRVDLLKSYEYISNLYADQKNYEQAYFYERQVTLLKDTIFNEGNREKITTMQTFFDAEKHKTELDLVKKDQEIKQDKIQQQRLFLYLVVSAAFLLSIIILLQWKSMQNRKMTAQKLLMQNNEINEQRKLLEIKNKDVKSSIEYAQRIQTAILPTEQQIQDILPQSFVLYMPRDIVSGDFYWFAEVKSQEIEVREVQHDLSGDRLAIRFAPTIDDTIESRLAGYEKHTKAAIDPLLASNFYHMTPKAVIAVVDCTGHGVPGAFMSMIGNDLLNEIVKEKNIHSPDLILSELHKGVRHVLRQETTDNKDGMDAVVCIIDKQHEVIEFAGAMNPIFVVQDYILRTESEFWTSITKFKLNEQQMITHFDNNLFEIKGDKKPIGGGGHTGNHHRTYTKHTIALAADQQHIPTTIYLCTDGYQDQFGGARNKKFMNKQLRVLLQEIHTKPLAEQKKMLIDRHLQWRGNNEQTDDMLIMAVRV